MEYRDIYNKERIKTGKVKKRSEALNTDEFCLVIHVCIFNSTNQLLIQQRQPFKESWSNMWDLTVGGSATSGEHSDLAATRELYEEIGYKKDLSAIRPSFTINFDYGFDDYYVINEEIDINKLKLQESEVKNIKWATKEEVLQMISTKEFIPYHHSVIEMIFDMKNRYGAHSINT